jgi:hypothetical protein
MRNYYTPEASLSVATLEALAFAEYADRAVLRRRFDLVDALAAVERLEDEVRFFIAEGWDTGDLHDRIDAAVAEVARAEARLRDAERRLRAIDARI